MTYVVSTLQSVGNGAARVSLLLSYNGDEETKGIQATRKLLSEFGAKLGTDANSVLPIDTAQATSAVAQQIGQKAWPADIANHLQDGATCLIAVEGDFLTFMPEQHNWAIILLDKVWSKKTYVQDRLAQIEKELRLGESILAAWEARAKNDQAKASQAMISKAYPKIQSNDRAAEKKRPGPKGIMAEELGVKKFIADLHANGHLDPRVEPYVDAVAEHVKEHLKKQGQPYDKKSISERIRKNRLLEPYKPK